MCDCAGRTSNEASSSGPLLFLASRDLWVFAGSTRCGREIAVVASARMAMRLVSCMIVFVVMFFLGGELSFRTKVVL